MMFSYNLILYFQGRVGLWTAPTNAFPGAVEVVARPWKWIFRGGFVARP